MNLKDIRISAGLTMCQVAEKAKISISYYCLIEAGKRRASVKVAKRLGKLYGIPWTDFFKDVA